MQLKKQLRKLSRKERDGHKCEGCNNWLRTGEDKYGCPHCVSRNERIHAKDSFSERVERLKNKWK